MSIEKKIGKNKKHREAHQRKKGKVTFDFYLDYAFIALCFLYVVK
jgi:hypothetical protein